MYSILSVIHFYTYYEGCVKQLELNFFFLMAFGKKMCRKLALFYFYLVTTLAQPIPTLNMYLSSRSRAEIRTLDPHKNGLRGPRKFKIDETFVFNRAKCTKSQENRRGCCQTQESLRWNYSNIN